MAKGASIKFKSYSESVNQILDVLQLSKELKKHDKIVLKPILSPAKKSSTSPAFLEQVLRFCLINKNPVTEVYIAEGADGADTEEFFELYGYKKLAEKYDVALIDLNNTETETVEKSNFLTFAGINYPRILLESFVIALPTLAEDEEYGINGALPSMLGAFPSSFYKGFFTKKKTKIRRRAIENSIYDINQCKLPNFVVCDASSKGVLLAGLPLEIDKQSAKLLGKEWEKIPYLKLFEEMSQTAGKNKEENQ